MTGRPTLRFPTVLREFRARKFVLTILVIYLIIAGLFGVLIYGLHWNQPATRWASQIFPLPAALVNSDMVWLSSYYRRLAIFEHYTKRVEVEQPDVLPDDPIEREKKTLDQLVEITLLKHEAKRAGIRVTDQEIKESFQKLVDQNGGEESFEKVLADFYQLSPVQFAREFIPEQLYRDKLAQQLFTRIKVRHIVVKDAGTAQNLIDRLNKGEDFDVLAKEFSQDLSTRDNGGDLGFIRRGQLAKSFEDSAFTLKAGETTQAPTATEFGSHVIRVDERVDGPIGDQSFSEWFEQLKTDAKIRRFVAR